MNSLFLVQNSSFHTCSEIIAVTLAQGDPPPCFLEHCAYESAFKEVDMMDIDEHNLTVKEKQLLNDDRSDCSQHADFIIDNGYTGEIKGGNMKAIIRSLQVSFVSRRCLYMEEFMIERSYGLDNIIIKMPLVCQLLFVIGELKEEVAPAADYLFSLLEPHYSRVGTSRR